MNEDIHSLIGAYVLDALSNEERALFEGHLEACASCRRERDELAEALPPLADAVAESPPASLRAASLAAIDGVRPLPPMVGSAPEASSGSNGFVQDGSAGNVTEIGTVADGRPKRSISGSFRRWPLAVAAAVIVIVGAVAVVARPWSSSDEPMTVAAVLDAGDARSVEVSHDGMVAKVVASRSKDRAVVVAADMPAAPAGQVYQFWFKRPDGDMVSAGMAPREAGDLEMMLEGPLDGATAVGMTMEPMGGSPRPTSEPMMMFELA